MGEVIGIVGIAAGAVVSLGSVAVTGVSDRGRRIWESKEERTVDLRTVLERAAESFGRAMFVAGETFIELDEQGQMTLERDKEMNDANTQVVLLGSQVGVRRGPTSKVYTTYQDCFRAFYSAAKVLRELKEGAELDEARRDAYEQAEAHAAAAETAFLKATAEMLSVSVDDGNLRQGGDLA